MTDADSGWAGVLRRRWDYDPGPESEAAFETTLVEINLRRVELAALVSLANSAFQIYLGLTNHALTGDSWLAIGSIPILIGFLLLAGRLRGGGPPALRRALPTALVVFSLALAQAAVSILAADGRLTTGYPLVVLAAALVFVFPPRTLALLLVGGLAVYLVTIGALPIPAWEKSVAALTALICTGVAVASGVLIHASRRRDHEQKALIRTQNARLKARDREMDELMAVTAHDLRSPLLGLRHLIALATRRAPSDPKVLTQVMGQAQAGVDAMLDLIDGVLAGHAADHGGPLPLTPLDLRAEVGPALERASPLARRAGLTLASETAEAPVPADIERLALARMLDNLIANAVQASPMGGVVTVACDRADGRARLAVSDQGPGLDPDEAARAFDKFWRGAASGRRAPGGAGLGLYITQGLAKRMGAVVRHRPNAPSGAVFEILFADASTDAGRVAALPRSDFKDMTQ